jgi:hypothetical protein
MRVVQIEPGPTPTFTASTPASISARVAAPVATLPATSCSRGKFLRVARTASITPAEWPWAVSMQMTSHPAASSASMRASRSPPTPTAAPQRSRPRSSLAANGCASACSMSLIVMRPFRRPLSSTTSSFSMRFLCSSSLAASSPTSSPTLMSLLGHHVGDLLGQVALEPHVAVGEDADRALVAVDHRQAADVVAAHQRQRVLEPTLGADRHRVDHDAALGLLDLGDLAGLLLDRQVLVQEPDAALAGHADRRRRLGDRVHRRADQRHPQRDLGRQPRRDIDVLGHHLAERRSQEHIVERQRLAQGVREHRDSP